MTLLQIRYFMEAAKYGNLTKTAKAMFVVQPAVTKQLLEFEKELGVRLFIRQPKGVELAPEGEIMLRMFERCKAEYESALRQARALNPSSEKVTVALLSSVDLYTVTDSISAFAKEHGDITVELTRLPMGEIYQALERDEVNLAIVFDTSIPQNRGIRRRDLFPSRDYLLVSKASPLAKKDSVSKEDLKDASVVIQRFPNNIFRSKFDPQANVCASLGFRKDKIVYCSNYESCLSAVEYGKGVMVIDERTVFPNRDNFKMLDTGLEHCVSVAWSGEEPSGAAAALIEHLINAFPSDS